MRRRSLIDDRSAMRLVVLLLAAMWIALPVLYVGKRGEDAVPLVVAGEMVSVDPEQIYPNGGLTDVGPDFRSRACEALADGGRCPIESVTAFLSSPAVLPLAVMLADAGVDTGITLLRFVAVGAATASLALAWRDLSRRPRSGAAAVAFAGLALTPIVVYTVGLGQTSTLLLLAVAAGSPAVGGWRAVVTVGAWAGVTALKAFPAAAAVAVRRSGVRGLAFGVVVLVLMTAAGLALAGAARLSDFLEAASGIAKDARSGQRSGGLESVADLVFDGSLTISVVAWAIRVLLLWSVFVGVRRGDAELRWAGGVFASVLLSPQVWVHYLIVIPGVGLAVARRGSSHGFAVASLATIPAVLAVAYAEGAALTVVVAVSLAATACWLGWSRPGDSLAEPMPSKAAASTLCSGQ